MLEKQETKIKIKFKKRFDISSRLLCHTKQHHRDTCIYFNRWFYIPAYVYLC